MILTDQKPVGESPLVLQEIDEPKPAAGEVRIKVNVCAVCRTDIHIVEGDLELHRKPLVPGHQIVGHIDDVGRIAERIPDRDWQTVWFECPAEMDDLLVHDSAATETDGSSITVPAAKILWSTATISSLTRSKLTNMIL